MHVPGALNYVANGLIHHNTGIGKGRVVAAMLRYAMFQGKIPIFVTEKQALYADMYRDLVDIGMGPGIANQIMQTNSDTIILDDDRGVKLVSPSGWARKLGMAREIPHGKKIVFTTYDQLNTQFERGSDRMAPRRRFIDTLLRSGKAVLVMDESHNAGGSGDLTNIRPDRKTGIVPHPRALFFRQMIPLADGVVYSSATYAKNPEVMDLYSATDLRLGVGGDMESLAETVTQGGVPFQQITAAMLASSGQYIRRERSFDGVTYTPKLFEVDTAAAERVSATMASIREFEEMFVVAALEEDGEGSQSNAVGSKGEKAQSFTSLMHNIVSQMLLSLKTKPAVAEAIRILQAGSANNEQVVLTVSNTMGAFIADFATAMKLVEGQEIDIRFNDLLNRYLYNTRKYTTGEKDEKGDPIYFWMDDGMLGDEGVKAYDFLVKTIDALDLSSMPVSPVDFMHHELQKAGFPALEITGRDFMVDYSQSPPRLKKRDPKEKTVNGRIGTIRAFNHGEKRAIILNRSGSTGISLHASERNPERGRGKRTMIVVQAEADINVHMQMLGRIHRTGQVVTPDYIQAVANIPAEKKYAAMLVLRMASLNANTTADADSLFVDRNTTNFLNKYGNRVFAHALTQNPDLNRRLGSPFQKGEGGKAPNIDGLAKKVTGRLPLLPMAEQEAVYAALEEAYRDYIAELDAVGRNDLDAKTFDLDARTLERMEVTPDGGPSPFQGPVVTELVDMKRIGKPFTGEELQALVTENTDAGEADATAAMEEYETYRREILAAAEKKVNEATTDLARDGAQKNLDELTSRLADGAREFDRLNNTFKVGRTLSVEGVTPDTLFGVVVGKLKRGKPKNPLSLGSWRVRIAVADGIRLLDLPFTRFASGSDSGLAVSRTTYSLDEMSGVFDHANSVSREKRWIVTGNLFRGFSMFRESNGRIMHFTREDGTIEQGVLLPAGYDPQATIDKAPVVFETPDQAIAYMKQVGNSVVNLRQTGGLRLVHTADGEFRVATEKATSRAGRFFRDDRKLLQITGPFSSIGDRMVTMLLDEGAVRDVFSLFQARGNSWFAETNLDTARKIVHGETRRSVAAGRSTTIADRAVVGKEIVRKIGRKAWDALQRSGKVRIITPGQAAALGIVEEDGAVTQGFVQGGTVYLIEGNIEPGQVWQVLLHELGVHAGLQGVLGARYDSLLKQVQLMRRAGNKKVQAAWEKIPKEDRDGRRGDEELVAYLVEHHPELSVVERIIAAIKAWVGDFFGLDLKLNEKDVVYLAGAAVRREARKALAVDTGDVIEENHGNTRRGQDTAGDLGLDGTLSRVEGGGPLAFQESVSRRRPPAAAPRTASQADFTSDRFRLWFGKSRLKFQDSGRPIPFFHGSRTFGNTDPLTGPDGNWTFDNSRLGKNTGSPMSSLGFFFTPDQTEAAGYSRGTGNVQQFFLRLENPKVMEFGQLPDFKTHEEARAYRKRLTELDGHDGIWLRDMQHAILFSGNQAKSSAFTTGEFSRDNDDTRRSVRATTQANPRNLPHTGRELAQQYFQQTKPKGWAQQAVSWVAGKVKDHKGMILGAFTLQQLEEMYGAKFPAVRKFYQAARAVSGLTNKLMTDSDRLHREWSKMAQGESDRMASVMHLATIHSLDPDTMTREDVEKLQERLARARTASATASKNPGLLGPEAMARVKLRMEKQVKRLEATVSAALALQSEWATLKPETQAMYRKIRDAHTERFLQLRDALEEQVEKAVADGKSRSTTLKMIRLKFEQQIKRGPYFPLSRFGDFVVTARLMNNKVEMDRVVSTFETSAEAEAFAAEMEKKGYTTATKVQKTHSRNDAAPGAFAQEVVGIINKKREVMGDKLTDRLLDQLNQALIKALPDLSFRKHFIHRKGVAGFSQDALRSFASAMQHSAHHIARIQHGSGMVDALNDMDTSLASSVAGDHTLLGEVRNELVKREEAINNPNIHPFAQFLTSWGFVWNIGPSIASGLVNMTQTPLVTGPYLAARYGWGKTTSAVSKAAADFARKSEFTKENGFSLQGTRGISRDELDMIQLLIDKGTIDVSRAHDLAAAAGTDYLNLSGAGKRAQQWAKAMKIVSWPFHVTELANRQVSALAAYRLARGAGKDHAAAVDFADKAVMDTHFDYSQGNRARHMQGNFARVILLFKQYSQNMSFLLGRSLQQALKGESAEVKQIARAQLTGILGGHFLVSGALGLPVLGMVGGVLEMLASAFGDDDEPWDYETELRNYLAQTVGKDMGEAVAHGPMRLVLPFDIAGRLSLSDLWYRSPHRELEGRAAFSQQLQNLLGPTASNMGMLYSGASAMADGEVLRGMEMMLPKAVKDLLKTARYAGEGVRNWKDDVLIEDLSGIELVGQMIGFTPRRVSEMYSAQRSVKNTESALDSRRSKLLNKMVQARLNKDTGEVAEAQVEIARFNRSHPELQITMESIYRSMQNRKRIRANTKDGTYLPEKRASLREYGSYANID